MGKMLLTSCCALSTPGTFSNVDRYGGGGGNELTNGVKTYIRGNELIWSISVNFCKFFVAFELLQTLKIIKNLADTFLNQEV